MASKKTTDHQTIREWAEARNGFPARVKDTDDEKRGGGILRIDFNEENENLERISWETFFETFDERSLVFLYQDQTADGNESRFFKFVTRETANATS